MMVIWWYADLRMQKMNKYIIWVLTNGISTVYDYNMENLKCSCGGTYCRLCDLGLVDNSHYFKIYSCTRCGKESPRYIFSLVGNPDRYMGGINLPQNHILSVPDLSPRASAREKKDYFLEYGSHDGNNMSLHRWAYQQSIGKRIQWDWVVHHINGIKGDNRVSNLYAMPPKAHGKTVIHIVSVLQARIRELEHRIGSGIDNNNPTRFGCLRCNHNWFSRVKRYPRICPKCKSPYWDKPRKATKVNPATKIEESDTLSE